MYIDGILIFAEGEKELEIWWWDSNSEILESVEFPFIVITPSDTLTQRGSTC